jgi:peptide/nickel transport system ATP-binding protein
VQTSITPCKDIFLSSNDIKIDNLSVGFISDKKEVKAVEDVSMVIKGNQITGIVGETGCGKSVLGMSMLQLLPGNTRLRGHIHYRGEDLLTLKGNRLQDLRRSQISLIPQNPSTSLNPIMKIKEQVAEAMEKQDTKNSRDSLVLKLFKALHLNESGPIANGYPFQLSGGMKQRVLTAIGLCRNPPWILADEPTKGLDACLRSETCTLLEDIYSKTGTGIMIITHDLLLARKLCHNIAVMYCGKVVETAPARDFFSTPAHPYSRALLKSLPQGGFTPIAGDTPSMITPPPGCRFHPRCDF